MTENQIANKIVNAAIRVHKSVGPGLLESAYESCLYYELSKYDLKIERQKPLKLIYDDHTMDVAYRLDLLVEGKVVIEVKSVECLHNIHLAQILTYLKLSDCKLGFLLNFNSTLMKHGIKRVANGM